MVEINLNRIRLEHDGLLVLSDHGPIGVTDEKALAQIRRFIPLLHNQRSRDQSARLTVQEKAQVRAFLKLLVDAGVATFSRRPGKLDYSSRRGFPLMDAHVVFVGATLWSMVAARELAAQGLGRITIYGDSQVSEVDSLVGNYLKNQSLGTSRVRALTNYLESVAPNCAAVYEGVSSPSRQELIAAKRESPLLVVGAVATSRLDLQISLERICRSVDVPFIGVELVGFKGAIGPFSAVGHAGCWFCSKLRRLANSPDAWANNRHVSLGMSGVEFQMTPEDPYACLSAGRTLANEIARFFDCSSQLFGKVLIQTGRTAVTSLHSFLPMPWCQVCGGAAKLGSDLAQKLPVHIESCQTADELMKALYNLVDEEMGIVARVFRREPHQSEPRLPFTSVAIANSYSEGNEYWPVEPASGKGMSDFAATIGALGEAIERYCASRNAVDALTCARIHELPGDVIHPAMLCLYDSTQYNTIGFPFRPFDPDQAHYWVQGKWLDTNQPVWIAASQVFYKFRSSFDDYFCQITTNGLAAGTSIESATERAVFELIERDSTMLTWLCFGKGRRLIPDVDDDCINSIISQLTDCGAHIELYALDSVGNIPVVACFGFGDGISWPGLTASSAAGYDVLSAVRSALLEQGMTGVGLRRMMLKGTGPRPLTAKEVRSDCFLDHAAYHIRPRHELVKFMRTAGSDGIPLSSFESGSPSFPEILTLLRQDGIRVAIIDLTSPDIALGPFHVVRAVAPGLQPIHCGFGMERRAGARLATHLLGGLNEIPHPFC